MKKSIILFLFTILVYFSSLAQIQPMDKDSNEKTTSSAQVQTPTQGEPTTEALKDRSPIETSMGIAVLAFGGLLMVLIIAYLFWLSHKGQKIGTNEIIVLSLTLIIIGSIFLVPVGWNNDQIAPISGLFGSIIGYLLGQSKSEK
jgi:hypothetical protein